MEIEYCYDGLEYIKVTDIDLSDVKTEADWLLYASKPPKETGSAMDDNGKPRKSNKGLMFSDVYLPQYSDCSPSSRMALEILEACKSLNFTPNAIMQKLYCVGGFGMLSSSYFDGDHYYSHRDSSALTLLLWPSEKVFGGGDLTFTDFNVTIPYEKDTAILFPSWYRHEVSKVFDCNGVPRHCVTAFIS